MLLVFDFHSATPLYQQLRDQVVVGIAQGRLLPGEQLPTIRALAEESGINMMTVSKAYQLLKQEGYIRTDRRSGAVVSAFPETALPSPETLRALRVLLSELRLRGLGEDEILALCGKMLKEAGHDL